MRALRERAGLSPTEAAGRAGIPLCCLGRVESGDHDPSWEEMRRVARGLGVSLEELAEVAEEEEEEG